MNHGWAQTEHWLDRLRAAAAALGRPVKFMEVCGVHATSALHGLLPPNISLVSGPGCPVSVTAQGDIDQIVALSARRGVTLCTYSDLLEVPGSRGTLKRSQDRGADVRVVFSAMDAVRMAVAEPLRQFVFTAVGFETSASATAAAVTRAAAMELTNFTVLTSHKRVAPAMMALLEASNGQLDGFVCPGHVSVMVGADAFEPVVERYRLPCVITGYEDTQIASGVSRLTEMVRDGRAAVVNEYPQAVSASGNTAAMGLIDAVFEARAVRWRGLGQIADSGLVLREEFNRFCARRRFALGVPSDREHGSCACGRVIAGGSRPDDCPLFAGVCAPQHPVGPSMASPEGACQAWFRFHRVRLEAAS